MAYHTAKRSRVPEPRQLPSGRWRARITAGFRADGSKRTVSKTFDTKADAQAWILQESVDLGRRPDLDAGVTLSTLWKLYESDKGTRLSKKTLIGYRSQMRTWLASMGDVDISHITCPDVQRVISGMTHENALHSKRALSSVLTYAVSEGLLSKNPLHGHVFEIPDNTPSEDDFDLDPFAAIEGMRNVWDVATVMECFRMIRGLPLEPAWLACIGAGLRVEEALALRKKDVRRVKVGNRMREAVTEDGEVVTVDVPVFATQIAVHHASTATERRKATKTRQSVRVVTMIEPFGERYWELVSAVAETGDPVCPIGAANQNKRWRGYFEPPSTSKHAPRKEGRNNLGRLHELPYLPLSRMRNTHATLMQQAGVMDSINAAMHGHSERVSYKHYQRPDTTEAAVSASERLRLVI